MTHARATAGRLLRDFARATNLLVAARPVVVVAPSTEHGADVAVALSRMAAALGARVLGAATGASDEVVFDLTGAAPTVTLGGNALPTREGADARIDFAGEHMPVSRALAREAAASGVLAGVRVGVCIIVEPKTAQLALLLAQAGAVVSVYAHPDELDTEVAAALAARGIPVDGALTWSTPEQREGALAFMRRGLDVLIDDGSHLIRLAHEAEPGLVQGWMGAAEETTSGLRALRVMERDGALRTAVIAVNDAPTKTLFDNRYGTGQSCAFAIADLLDNAGIGIVGEPALVIGYGPVGKGVAACLAALGADVAVAEADAVQALEAAHDGYRVGLAAELAPGALVVSATGAAHTITTDVLALARAVAVAGGVPGEVDLDQAIAAGATLEPTANAHVNTLAPHGTLVLAGGGCVNLTAGEGNPIEIMDLSFATQIVAVSHLVTARPVQGVHPLPASASDHVARVAVRERGLSVAPIAPAQAAAEADWRSRRFLTQETQ